MNITNNIAAILGSEKAKSTIDKSFEDAVFSNPSSPKVDITSDEVHKRAIAYNRDMNSKATMRSEISGYLRWAAIGIFSTALAGSVAGQLGGVMTALASPMGLGLLAGAVALAGSAIYLGVCNAKLQSEKNMNLNEFEMRRSGKILAKEIAQEIKAPPQTSPGHVSEEPVNPLRMNVSSGQRPHTIIDTEYARAQGSLTVPLTEGVTLH